MGGLNVACDADKKDNRLKAPLLKDKLSKYIEELEKRKVIPSNTGKMKK